MTSSLFVYDRAALFTIKDFSDPAAVIRSVAEGRWIFFNLTSDGVLFTLISDRGWGMEG